MKFKAFVETEELPVGTHDAEQVGRVVCWEFEGKTFSVFLEEGIGGKRPVKITVSESGDIELDG